MIPNDPDVKKCDFAALQGLLQQVTTTNTAVTKEVEVWIQRMGIASMDMLDLAGGAFTDVAAAINQVSIASQEMQAALIGAGANALEGNMSTVQQCAAQYDA